MRVPTIPASHANAHSHIRRAIVLTNWSNCSFALSAFTQNVLNSNLNSNANVKSSRDRLGAQVGRVVAQKVAGPALHIKRKVEKELQSSTMATSGFVELAARWRNRQLIYIHFPIFGNLFVCQANNRHLAVETRSKTVQTRGLNIYIFTDRSFASLLSQAFVLLGQFFDEIKNHFHSRLRFDWKVLGCPQTLLSISSKTQICIWTGGTLERGSCNWNSSNTRVTFCWQMSYKDVPGSQLNMSSCSLEQLELDIHRTLSSIVSPVGTTDYRRTDCNENCDQKQAQ